MPEFQQMRFGDFVTLQRGFDLPRGDREAGPFPVVASTSIQGSHIAYRVEPPGVTTGRSGSLGTVLFIKERFWPLNTALWVKDFKGNSARFVYYFMQTLGLERYNAGVGVPTLNRNHLDGIEVRVPDRPTQRKIATLLAAYDELIENNLRRIEILEETAQAIYHEWFVEFRFPGHEDVPLVDSSLGPIPIDWHTDDVGDLSDNFDRLRKPLSSLERATMVGEYPYFGAAKVIDFVNDYLFDGEYLLVAEDGSVITPDGFPVLQLVSGQFWVNNHAHVLKGAAVPTRFLHLALSRYPIVGHITGAAQPKITQTALNRIPVLLPPGGLMAHFTQLIDPLFDLRQNLLQQNANLRATRDLLLPRLVSGELDVSDLDIDTEWLTS